MQAVVKAYRFLNLLSIDVAIGSVCSALFFSRIFQVALLPYGLAVLAITVWVIYTVDHLLDARKIPQPASTERHQFHQRNFSILTRVVWIAIFANCVLIYFIRKPVLVAGVFLIAGVGLYLLAQQYMKISKEVVIALLYTLGVAMPSLAVTDILVKQWPWVLLIQFFLMAFTNLILFAWFDRERDRKDHRSSLVMTVGEKGSRYLIWAGLVLTGLLTFFSENKIASAFILIDATILLIIFINHVFFGQHDRFRLLGDAVFFVPLLYWLI